MDNVKTGTPDIEVKSGEYADVKINWRIGVAEKEYKSVIDGSHFRNELDVYETLGDRPYLPKFHGACGNVLTVEALKPSLEEYIESHDKIPEDLLLQHFRIRMDMLEGGFIDYSDSFKPDHLFYVDGQLKLADFGTCDRVSGMTVEYCKKILLEQYAFLWDRKDSYSLDKALEEFGMVFVNKPQVREFRKNLKRISD